jgi:hypothetical protein
MNELKLTLSKKWFDMIKSGEKTEEYREIKPYWIKRLVSNRDVMSFYYLESSTMEFVKFDQIHFFNGSYFSEKLPNFKIECLGIEIGKGNPECGATEDVYYFKIKLGRLK